MRSSPRARLARIEAAVPGQVDLASEVARYGEPLWSVAGARCYSRQDPDGGRLTVIAAGGTVTYELIGVDLEALR